jgi:D-alanyl-D-alanine carboxypeptidase
MDFRKFLDNFVLVFALICLFGFFLIFTQIFSGNLEKFVLEITEFTQSNILDSSKNIILKEVLLTKHKNVENLETNIESGIVVYLYDTKQEIIFEKNEKKILPIASITKLLTALIVLENYNLNDKVIISKVAEERAGSLIAGDEFFVKDLLKIMMVQSDNVAAYALSGKMGQNNFVKLMNKKAKDIGMQNTSFDNSVGMGPKTISTANDLVLLAKEILEKKPEIFELSLIKNFDMYDTSGILKSKVKNINQLLFDDSFEFKDLIIGGKTGANLYAGECLLLVSKSFNNSGYIVSVVLNAGPNINDRFNQTKKIINWVKNTYIWK